MRSFVPPVPCICVCLVAVSAGLGCGMSRSAKLCSTDSVLTATRSYGKPRPVIDTVGWVWGIPKKILLWDRRIENHDVSEATVDQVTTYLEANRLSNVHVRVNEYAPVDEWRRLTENEQVSPGWRYTMGVLHLAGYTVFPGRIFGGDRYNPYTNTMYLYSDSAPMGLAEAAYAKNVSRRNYPGTYAFTQEFPILAMHHETLATQEALSYVEQSGSPEELSDTRRILYPRYGMAAGATISDLVPVLAPAPEIIGAVAGHATNRYWFNQPTSTPREETVRSQSDEE